MKLNKTDYIIFILVSLTLVLDHFTDVVSHNILSLVFAGVIIYSLNYKKKNFSITQILKWQLLSTGIIAFLVVVFTIIGTVSKPAISLSSGVFWFLILLSIFDIVYQRRQIKQGTDDR